MKNYKSTRENFSKLRQVGKNSFRRHTKGSRHRIAKSRTDKLYERMEKLNRELINGNH